MLFVTRILISLQAQQSTARWPLHYICTLLGYVTGDIVTKDVKGNGVDCRQLMGLRGTKSPFISSRYLHVLYCDVSYYMKGVFISTYLTLLRNVASHYFELLLVPKWYFLTYLLE